VIFLHGSAERGNDNAAQLLNGGYLFIKDAVRTAYPAYVVFPQLPTDSTWAPRQISQDSAGHRIGFIFPDAGPTKVEQLLMLLKDSLVKAGTINSHRIYLGGLSLGGIGTYDLLARYPQVWAAAFPICGAGNVAFAVKFKEVPLWIFHGEIDQRVPVSYSRSYYKTLQDLHAEVKYNEYPGVGHNCWIKAFAEPDLIPWLFSHQRTK
jgi:predicted peptidase